MKKTILLLLLVIGQGNTYAQMSKMEILYDIMKIAKAGEIVDNGSGYKRSIVSCIAPYGNDCYLEFGVMEGDGKKVGDITYYAIDMSKVDRVSKGETLTGHPCVGARSPIENITIMKMSYQAGSIWTRTETAMRTFALPTENGELLTLMNDYADVCRSEAEKEPNAFPGLPAPKEKEEVDFNPNSEYSKYLREKKKKEEAVKLISTALDASAKFEVEGGFSLTDGIKTTNVIHNTALMKLVFDPEASFHFLLGIGIGWLDRPDYRIYYNDKDDVKDLPADFPKDSSSFSVGNIEQITLVCGFQGSIPLDKKNSPYNFLDLTWELSGTMGTFQGSGHLKNDLYYLEAELGEFSSDPFFTARGMLGLDLYLGDAFGIGVHGGYSYFITDVNKARETRFYSNESRRADNSFPLTAQPEVSKRLLPFIGLKLNVRVK